MSDSVADIPLLNTNIYAIPITRTTTPAGGTPTTAPMPPTEQITASVSTNAVAAAVGPDPSGATLWLTLTPMVALSEASNGGGGIMVTLSDNDGDLPDQEGPFSVTGEPPITGIGHGSMIVSGTQAVPGSPGPTVPTA